MDFLEVVVVINKKKLFELGIFLVLVPALCLAAPKKRTASPMEPQQMAMPLSQAIIELATTYFTPEKLAVAQIETRISPETRTCIERMQQYLPTTIMRADQVFSNPEIPGYTELKKKILAYMQHFSVCLGYNRAEITQKNAELTELLQNISQKMTEQQATDDDFKQTSPTTGEKRFKHFLQYKKNYFSLLRELDTLSPTDAVRHERPEKDLTLRHAYTDRLLYLQGQLSQHDASNAGSAQEAPKAKRKRKSDPGQATEQRHLDGIKKAYAKCFHRLVTLAPDAARQFEIRELELLVDTQQPVAHNCYNAYAIGLRSCLYELEAALQAIDHGEAIIAFDAQVTLTFNTETQSALVQEIQSHPTYLQPTFPHNTHQCILSQEFDLITDHHIIECKCINHAIDEYITNLQREQFIAQHVRDAVGYTVLSGGQNLSASLTPLITDKRVICYVKYTEFAQQNLYSQTHAQEEMRLLEQGFPLWNGVMYCYTLTQDYFNREQSPYTSLQETIRRVGPDRFLLHIIVANETEKNARVVALEDAGIEKMTPSQQAGSPAVNAEKLVHYHRRIKESPRKRKVSEQDQTLFIRSIFFTIINPTAPEAAAGLTSPLRHALHELQVNSPQPQAIGCAAAGGSPAGAVAANGKDSTPKRARKDLGQGSGTTAEKEKAPAQEDVEQLEKKHGDNPDEESEGDPMEEFGPFGQLPPDLLAAALAQQAGQADELAADVQGPAHAVPVEPTEAAPMEDGPAHLENGGAAAGTPTDPVEAPAASQQRGACRSLFQQKDQR
jgi:hypothetical protein